MKTENKKTLRGTILFTVVCVMALLIIFLTGTLALASAAGNRAHKSYSTSQASYTARAAIDSFATAMQRNDAIAAAVTQVGTNGLSQLNPMVQIKDKSLGEIGYFDAQGHWVKDRILIEPVADSGEYRYLDQDGDGVYEWLKTEAVKISATCKVGKEYETVSAYIQKLPYSSNPVNPGGINGLQEAGSNAFPNGAIITGGLGIGIKEGDATNTYRTHNEQKIETTLTFVNGSLVGGTSGTKWYVKKPVDTASAPTPYSATVIDGNLMLENNTFMYLNYSVPKGTEWNQKEIPYLFVNGAVCHQKGTQGGVKLVQLDDGVKEAPPFNMFIGTLNIDGPIETCYATLYLMDEPDGTSYDVKHLTREGNADPNGDNKVEKGKNRIAGSTSNLYAWTSSIVQKTDSQFQSKAGSVYCKGDLYIDHANIYGDVRVEGNCEIGQQVTIYGNLVVGKTLSGDKPSMVGGKIYNNGAAGNANGGKSIKPGYSYHKNEMWPDVIKVDNLMYENTPVEGVEERSDRKMDHDPWHQEIEYPDGTVEDLVYGHKTIYIMPDKTTYYENRPYYRTDEFGFDDKTTVVFDEYTRHKIGPDGNVVYQRDGAGQIITNGDGVQMTELAKTDYTYYKMPAAIGGEYTEIDEKDAYGDYYMKDGETTTCSESEATIGQTSDQYQSIAQFYKDSGETSIYPTSMERENIYGEIGANGFAAGKSDTRIVKTLDEVRQALHADNKGQFDTTVYPNTIPDNLPYAYNNGAKTSVWEDGYITQSCILGDANKPGSYTVDETINIKPANSDIWVVLQGVTVDANQSINNKPSYKEIVCHRSAGGNVKFMVDGKNTLKNTMIRPNDFKAGMTVNYNDTWNIEYYGTAGSEFLMDNNVTVVGTFKAPTLNIANKCSGLVSVSYKDEYGKVWPNQKPVLVGSALVYSVTEAQNDFSVLNSGGGGNAGNQSVFKANDAYWQLTYYMGV